MTPPGKQNCDNTKIHRGSAGVKSLMTVHSVILPRNMSCLSLNFLQQRQKFHLKKEASPQLPLEKQGHVYLSIYIPYVHTYTYISCTHASFACRYIRISEDSQRRHTKTPEEPTEPRKHQRRRERTR